jgi:hypothetical protein
MVMGSHTGEAGRQQGSFVGSDRVWQTVTPRELVM